MNRRYTNGQVVTMDPTNPTAESLVSSGNTIIGVGTETAMQTLAADNCEIIDMEGGTLFPGFNETHTHLSWYAIFRQYAYLGDAETIQDIQEILRAHADTPDRGAKASMIIGYAYDDTGLSDGRQITRQDLDRVSSSRPVVVYHISVHLGFLNTRALEYFGITRDTVPKAGGAIHKDAGGTPTGRLDETAWFKIMAQLGRPDADRYKSLLKEAVTEFNTRGFTGVHDPAIGIEGMPEQVCETYRTLARSGELNLRVFGSATHDCYSRLERRPGETLRDNFFILGGAKLFLDGSIQAGTAALARPYFHDPGHKGGLIMDEDEFSNLVEAYHRDGVHLSVHGNGDLAIEAIITAFESALKKYPGTDSRHMLIHCQMAGTQHIRRMKAAGIIPSFFAMHIHHWGDRHRDIFLGPDRASRMDPAGEAEAAGLAFTLHVDTPVLPPQALLSIHTAVNRLTRKGRILGPDQAIAPETAVAAYTTMAARCSHTEELRGTIAKGKLADFTLLSRNILDCAPETISRTRVLRTVVDGRTVFKASP